MDIGQAIVLGYVQGITEFWPLSSTAHLPIVPFLDWDDPGVAFTAVIQLGTMAAILVYNASVAGLLKFLTTHSTRAFAAYRVVVGAAVPMLAATGTIS